MDIIKIVLILFVVFFAIAGVGYLTDFILYRNAETNCDFGYVTDCKHCLSIYGCHLGLRKKRYSKRWRDG